MGGLAGGSVNSLYDGVPLKSHGMSSLIIFTIVMGQGRGKGKEGACGASGSVCCYRIRL